MSATGVLGGWVLTYLVHSTLFIGVALAVGRFIPNESWRDVSWKTAILAGLLTSGLVAAGGLEPLGGVWYAGDVLALPGDSEISTTGQVSSLLDGASRAMHGTASPAWTQTPESANPVSGWNLLVLGLIVGWVATSLGLIVRLAVANIRFLRSISDRRVRIDGALVDMLEVLKRDTNYRRPVRLSLSADCATPVAIGTREICLPVRFASDLDIEQQRAGLAHELAHLRRHDPVWQFVAAVIESVFFFQPLNRLIRNRLRQTAELLSDDWAATATGSPTALARCLSEVASWAGSCQLPRHAVAMVEGGSPLLVRIRRLAGPSPARPAGPSTRAGASLAVVAGVGLLAPTVTWDGTPVRPDMVAASCPLAAVDTMKLSPVGLRNLHLQIPAGSIRVAGKAGASEVRVISRRCASRLELLEALQLESSRSSSDLMLRFDQPTGLFSLTEGSIARIDLSVEVPESAAVLMEGGMTPVEVSNVGALRLETSLGDVRAVGVRGDVTVVTSVGEVVVGEVGGDVQIAAEVGGIHAWTIAGRLTLKEGHTGWVEVAGVEGDVVIEDGQTGDVAVSEVSGGLWVGHMPRGRLGVEDVSGPIVAADWQQPSGWSDD